MPTKWLVNRLTEEKKKSQRWVELAEALEQFWDQHFSVQADALENSRSIFTASTGDIEKKMAEYGDFFDVYLPLAETSKALAVDWRRYDLHIKDTAELVYSILHRNFSGLNAKWQPLYCKNEADYAALKLLSEDEIERLHESKARYFLTSRGRVWIDLRHMHQIFPNLEKGEVKQLIRSEIEKVRPSHIVYDGELFILTIDFWFKQLPHRVFFTYERTPAFHFNTLEVVYRRLCEIHGYEFKAMPPIKPAERICFDELPADFTPLDLLYESNSYANSA